MTLANLSAYVYETAVSQSIREITWLIPTVQSIHIVAIAMLFGSALVMELRLANLLARDQSAAAVVQRHLPWLWWALLGLLGTGLIMVIGEPDRTLNNDMFWNKMALVFVAFLMTQLFRRPLLSDDFRLEEAKWAAFVKPSAVILLLIWTAIIFCGRWIAYVV